MTETVLYVYAITRGAVVPACEAVDRSQRFESLCAGEVCAIYTPVDGAAFSQESIDRRAGDLEWLGAIGYRHQAVAAELMKSTAVLPLRAFTMFSGEPALRQFLDEHHGQLAESLRRLDGKQEWTLRIELDSERWSDALVLRVTSLRELAEEAERASSGKAFLLRKKLEEERKRASKEAEQEMVSEVEQAVLGKLRCETVAESRLERNGAFPQINVLINRDEEAALQELHAALLEQYQPFGVNVALTGPWPPYSFVGRMRDEG